MWLHWTWNFLKSSLFQHNCYIFLRKTLNPLHINEKAQCDYLCWCLDWNQKLKFVRSTLRKAELCKIKSEINSKLFNIYANVNPKLCKSNAKLKAKLGKIFAKFKVIFCKIYAKVKTRRRGNVRSHIKFLPRWSAFFTLLSTKWGRDKKIRYHQIVQQNTKWVKQYLRGPVRPVTNIIWWPEEMAIEIK